MEKGNNCGQKFPPAFGDTPDDFLIRFGRLIYTIIHRRCKGKQMVICSDGKYINVALEPENVLHGFIVYIAKNDYMVLHNYQGLNKAKPQTYLTGVLNWFLLAEVKKEAKRKMIEINDEEAVSCALSMDDPSENLIRKERGNLLDEALKAAMAKLRNDKERLIIDLFYEQGKKAGDIANLFRMKEKAAYKITEKFRNFFKYELEVRGIF